MEKVYTQAELAARLGVNRSTVWDWMQAGKVQTDALKRGRPAFSEQRAAEIEAWYARWRNGARIEAVA
jgi:predicted site-specific integrase-resolvase